MALKFRYKIVLLALVGLIVVLAGATWLCSCVKSAECVGDTSSGEKNATNAVSGIELKIQEVEALPVEEEDVCAASSDSPVRRKHRHSRRREKKSLKQLRQ